MRRRTIAILALVLACVVAAPAQAGESPRGVYAALEAADGAACARICADDSLCAAWSFQEANNMCALRATRPEAAAPAMAAPTQDQLRAETPPSQAMEAAADAGLLGGPETETATLAPLSDLRSRSDLFTARP